MSLPVVYQPKAQADIEQAFTWYEAQGAGLGGEFLRRVKLVELDIAREPALYALVRPPLRRATMRQFPYALFYVIEADRVAVLACLHHRRGPKALPAVG